MELPISTSACILLWFDCRQYFIAAAIDGRKMQMTRKAIAFLCCDKIMDNILHLKCEDHRICLGNGCIVGNICLGSGKLATRGDYEGSYCLPLRPTDGRLDSMVECAI